MFRFVQCICFELGFDLQGDNLTYRGVSCLSQNRKNVLLFVRLLLDWITQLLIRNGGVLKITTYVNLPTLYLKIYINIGLDLRFLDIILPSHIHYPQFVAKFNFRMPCRQGITHITASHLQSHRSARPFLVLIPVSLAFAVYITVVVELVTVYTLYTDFAKYFLLNLYL